MKCEINGYVIDNSDVKYLGRHITAPTAKRNFIEIPKRDGILDATDDRLKFNMRNISIRIELVKPRTEWAAYMSWLYNYVYFDHNNIELRFGDDEDYIWMGTASNIDFSDNKSTATITISFLVYPFKRQYVATVRNNRILSGSAWDVSFTMGSVPRKYIEFSKLEGADIYVYFGNDTFVLTDNNPKVELLLSETGNANQTYSIKLVTRGESSFAQYKERNGYL